MADTRYLTQRGNAWYFHRAVPADLRKAWNGLRREGRSVVGGRHPILIALGTTSLNTAQRKRWEVNAAVEDEFERLRGRPRPLTPVEIEAKARDEFENTLRLLQEIGVEADGLDQMIAREQQKLNLDNRREEDGHAVIVTDYDYARIRARIAAAEARRKALAGIVPDVPQSFGRRSVDPVTLQPITASVPRRAVASDSPLFAEVAARFLAERQRDPSVKLTEQTRGQYEAAYRLFDSWAKGPTMAAVERTRAAEFLDAIATLHPHWGRSPDTKQRSFAEVFERYGGSTPGLSNKTVNRVAMALSLVWKFAEERGLYDGKNPWERQGRTVTKRRGNRETDKRGYRPAEIKALLATPPDTAPKRANAETTLPWLILIALYSGMRLNEICSLDVEDVKEVGGIWLFDIPASKSEAGVRCVPIHSRIIAAGFLDYREHVRRGSLFPGLRPGGPDAKLSWYVSKAFTTFRRSLSIEELDSHGKDRLDFHSTRRTVVTALKQARIPEHEAAEIVGHEHERLTYGVYPDRQKLSALQSVVEVIRYEGVDD